MDESTNSRVALVTGAGSGLGAATVQAFAEAGYQVVGLDLRSIDVTETNGSADRVALFVADVSDADAVEKAVADVLERFGRIDVAINCAGIDHTYWLEQLTVEQFDQIIGVNLRGPFLIAKALWPVMKRQGGGHIVNIASTAAIRTWSGASAYHASKFGLLGLGRAMSSEGRQDNIRVTTVIPGGMDTGFFSRFVDQGIPLPDAATLQNPLDVARAIVYAVGMPSSSIIQELVITPPNEASWP